MSDNKKEFAFLEREASVRVSCRQSGRKRLLHRMRDALAESAPVLSMDEIRDQVAPDQMFSAALACLIFRIAGGRHEK